MGAACLENDCIPRNIKEDKKDEKMDDTGKEKWVDDNGSQDYDSCQDRNVAMTEFVIEAKDPIHKKN